VQPKFGTDSTPEQIVKDFNPHTAEQQKQQRHPYQTNIIL